MDMRTHLALIVLIASMMYPAAGSGQPTCVAPPLSDQQVKGIVEKERATRKDLPTPFPQSRWLVRRQGCHYAFIEYGLPEAPEYNNIIRLNQYGVVVDAQTGNPLSNEPVGAPKARSASPMNCPGKDLAENELAQIVKSERAKRHDLPPPFPQYKARVDRSRCLYLYFEYALPERRGDYQVFTIDPLGELMEFSRSQPY